MPIYQFEDRIPRIGAGSYIHPSAEVIGQVVIGERCWIGPGARIRGDYGEIIVGDETAIEDNCVLHARPGRPAGSGAMSPSATARSSIPRRSRTMRSSGWARW
jgi:carbonic anhydrase/acetyltransferase-like protein (isoleucine patch superfamily)